MKNFMHWITTVFTMGLFVFSMVLLPGLAAQTFAQDTAAPPAAAKEPSKDLGEFADRAVENAKTSGAQAGEETTAKLSTGTIITAAVVVATGVTIAIVANNDDGSSTSRH
ncbi:MAG TPA: hypothetical protein PLR71_14925 [Deltaproteobacteria bacterium]|nr:hypothetical protein [Deltaproteobacteria bacterium]